MNKTQRNIVRIFTKKNLLIRPDVVAILEKEISRYNSPMEVLNTVIEGVISHLDRRGSGGGGGGGGGGRAVDKEVITAVLEELAEDDTDVANRAIQVFSAFDLPRFRYDTGKKAFFR